MNKAKDGIFISFEGGEGSGKSTQITLLADYLKALKIPTLITREPGGSDGAEDIRKLLVQSGSHHWQPMTEVLLLYAARFEHVQTMIKPALQKGIWVLCDRFSDSTFAYQGAGHKLDFAQIMAIHHQVLGNFFPDLTLLLDIDPKIGLGRANAREQQKNITEDKYEQLDMAFHHALRQGYLQLAKQYSDRITIIDANQSEQMLARDIQQRVRDFIKVRGGIDG